MGRISNRTMKVLALVVFLAALALLIYSLPGNSTVTDLFPISPGLLSPPAGGPAVAP